MLDFPSWERGVGVPGRGGLENLGDGGWSTWERGGQGVRILDKGVIFPEGGGAVPGKGVWLEGAELGRTIWSQGISSSLTPYVILLDDVP